MKWLGCGIAVAAAILVTGSWLPLLFMLIPASSS